MKEDALSLTCDSGAGVYKYNAAYVVSYFTSPTPTHHGRVVSSPPQSTLCRQLMSSSVLCGVSAIKLINDIGYPLIFLVSTALVEAHAPRLSHHIIQQTSEESQVVELPEVGFKTFEVFTKWLEHVKNTSTSPSRRACLSDGELGWDAINLLLEIYEFSDKYDILELNNDLLHELSSFFEYIVTHPRRNNLDTFREEILDVVRRTWENSKPDSPLRELLVDGFCAARAAEIKYRQKDFIEGLPHKFLVDIMCREGEFISFDECGTACLEALKKWQKKWQKKWHTDDE